jgi:hypothetical protein
MGFFIIESMNFAQLLNRFRQRLIWVFPLLLGFTLAICLSFYIPASSLERTEILWDSWGVPHIYGKTQRDSSGIWLGADAESWRLDSTAVWSSTGTSG